MLPISNGWSVIKRCVWSFSIRPEDALMGPTFYNAETPTNGFLTTAVGGRDRKSAVYKKPTTEQHLPLLQRKPK